MIVLRERRIVAHLTGAQVTPDFAAFVAEDVAARRAVEEQVRAAS